MIRRSIRSDERAVSPVIATILMVSITVILAAVIGSYVLNIGEETQVAPQASFSCDSGGTITHQGGDNIPKSNLYDGGSTFDSSDFNGDGDDKFEASESVSASNNKLVYKKGGDSYVLKDCS